ncbi:MAG TPA: beta-L-arabinofuranosidase domain-containing protein [Armatimonadota bacterium]|jgi:hypothetical protein
MNLRSPLILGSFAFVSAIAAAAPPSQLKPVPFTSVTITDAFWAPRIQRNLEVTLPHNFQECEATGRISNFDKAAGKMAGEHEGYMFNDSDVYKVLEGAAYTLAYRRDPALEAKCDSIIDRIAAAQQPDGYLYTYYTIRKELNLRHTNEANMHETYCAGHLIEGAVAYFQATGKRKFLDVAIRLADYYDRLYGPGKRRDAPGHEEIELALVKLYRLTGQKRYLNLARFFVEERGHADGGRALQGEYSQDHIPVRQQREIQGHAVRAMYLYCGVADLAAISGDPGYLKTMDSIWPDVVDRKMYITGGIGPSGSNEGFTTAYDLPNDSAYAESCAAIALALWNQRKTLLYADGKYADVVERCMYNGLLSGVSLSGDRFFYGNPLGSRGGYQRSAWFACACCPPNLVRYIPTVGGLVYATTPTDLYVNHYMGNTGRMQVRNTSVTVTQVTRYPWDGAVKLTVAPVRPTPFTLRLRIPGWCQGPTVSSTLYRLQGMPASGAVTLKVNGKPARGMRVEKGYACVTRTWKRGDVVSWTMPMPVRRVHANPKVKYDIGKVALQRGPVVYCFEDVDNANRARRMAIPAGARITTKARPDLLGGVTVLNGQCIAQVTPGAAPSEASFTAVPYFAWDNRTPGGMAVWAPENPGALPAAMPPTIASASKASWSFMHVDAASINDQLAPRSSNDAETPHMDFWPHSGTTEWLQYTFAAPATVKGAEVYWFVDYPGGGCGAPASWHIEYRVGDAWKPVEANGPYAVEKDRLNRTEFKPVQTDALRLVVDCQRDLSAGVYEWRVLQ